MGTNCGSCGHMQIKNDFKEDTFAVCPFCGVIKPSKYACQAWYMATDRQIEERKRILGEVT